MKLGTTLLIMIISATNFAQQSSAKEAWLEKWENSKDYLVAIAEVMPEEHFGFKPTERQMSFKEQLIHIKGNMDWLSSTYFSEEDFNREKTVIPETKAAVIALLSEAFDAAKAKVESASEEDLERTIDFFDGPKSKLQILNLLQDHVSHHRGQLIVYLNLNSVEPPKYVGW